MKTLTAKDIMNPEVITVSDDLTVHELANLFTEKMISGAPVVDQEGRLVGVVSLSDIVRNDTQRATIVKERSETNFYLHGWEDRLTEEELSEFHVETIDEMLVRDIMTPILFEVSEDTSLAEMADMMINGRIHRLIVTRAGKVVGIVTTLDMLKAIRSHAA
ncbi:MAG: CBS domain-containing protein [Calditrichaeota bacterium]|nr:MAG: CBS domain-containing protein [Calditrichota bacterium]